MRSMSRESLIVLMGIILFVLPSLGVPESWKFYGTTGAGLLLIVVGYSLRHTVYKKRKERLVAALKDRVQLNRDPIAEVLDADPKTKDHD